MNLHTEMKVKCHQLWIFCIYLYFCT